MYLILNRGLRPTQKSQLDSEGIRIGVGVWVYSMAFDSENALCARINDKTIVDLAPAIRKTAEERLNKLGLMVLENKHTWPKTGVVIRDKLIHLYPLLADFDLLEEARALMAIVGLRAKGLEEMECVTKGSALGIDVQAARDYILNVAKNRTGT